MMYSVSTKKEAQEAKAWAYKVVKVEGGWMVFEYSTDYEIWINQK